jgi:hypothetical protein
MVLPVKYLDELKHLPPSVVSSLDAQFEVRVIYCAIYRRCSTYIGDRMRLETIRTSSSAVTCPRIQFESG